MKTLEEIERELFVADRLESLVRVVLMPGLSFEYCESGPNIKIIYPKLEFGNIPQCVLEGRLVDEEGMMELEIAGDDPNYYYAGIENENVIIQFKTDADIYFSVRAKEIADCEIID